MPGACGLRPSARTRLKKALCHICPLGNKYRVVAAVVQKYEKYGHQYWTLSFVTLDNISFLPLNHVFSFCVLTLGPHHDYRRYWKILSMMLRLLSILGKEVRLPTKTYASRLGVQNTPTVSLQRSTTPPASVLDMTVNNLMVRLQHCRSFGVHGEPLYCHCS